MITAGRVTGAMGRRARRVIEPAAVAAWRAAVRAGAIDDTAASAERTCVVFAPHPDDETFGCGATIARKRARGTAVRVVVATDGRRSHRSARLTPDDLAAVRAGEVAEACARLGVRADEVVLLGIEEGTLADDHDRLVAQLVEQLVDVAPDEVLVTSRRDWHPDHRALSAAVAAAAAHPTAGDGPLMRCAEYPVWLWADGPWRCPADTRGALRPFVTAWTERAQAVATDGFLAAKREALRCHRSQTTNLTGEPDWAVLDPTFRNRFLGSVELFFDRSGSRPDRVATGVSARATVPTDHLTGSSA